MSNGGVVFASVTHHVDVEDLPTPKYPYIEPGDAGLPTAYALHQNYPNPFNPTTTISFDLPEAADVTLIVYDVEGRTVAELANRRFDRGRHSVPFDGRNVATGVYFYRLSAGDYKEIRKMILLK